MTIKTSLSLLLLAPVMLSACATITKDASQTVQVETYSKDHQPITGAKCTAQNERGQWVTTSGSVYVHRSGENLMVTCDKDGEQTGHGTVISRANGGMFGNILFGGGVGAIIDHNKGTAYTYPSWVRIVMGENLIYDRRDEVENSPMLGKLTTADTVQTATAQQAQK